MEEVKVRMSSLPSGLIDVYQTLLITEIDPSSVSKKYSDCITTEKVKLEEGLTEGSPNFNNICLTENEIKCLCSKLAHDRNRCFNNLIRYNLLVDYGNGKFCTTHSDLLYRLVNIRNLYEQAPIPFEFKLTYKEEKVPDYNAKPLSTLSSLITNPQVTNILVNALIGINVKGFSDYQYKNLEELLVKRTSKCKIASISAPTASGKTFIFIIPILAKSIERKLNGGSGIVGILLYPRKALAKDQLHRMLKILDDINDQLRKIGKEPITIGIDDGDTLKDDELRKQISTNNGNPIDFRGLECPKCKSPLKIDYSGRIFCSNNHVFDYILGTKETIWRNKPTIYFSNIYTVYRRLISKHTISLFKNSDIEYIVLDEAHVYSDYLGGHLHYLLKLLKHATRRKPYFIFSSATIPKPRTFVAKLTGCKKDNVFYIDYEKSIKLSIGRRLKMYLYLLPSPLSSAEALFEAVTLAVTLWASKHKFKVISFVDSITEISTLYDYIKTTILGRRQGREILDHISYYNKNIPRSLQNSYIWDSLLSDDYKQLIGQSPKNFVDNFGSTISIHHGKLSLRDRVMTENDFKAGKIRNMIATSTLELGIDLSDVAAIVQYRLPVTPEGVIQRIGRAGRNESSLYISLGIVILTSSPLSTLYMFNDKLRDRLEKVSALPTLKVGRRSRNIKLQHLISLILYYRALRGVPTFMKRNEICGSFGCSVNDILRVVYEGIYNELTNNNYDKLKRINKSIKLFEENELDLLRKELSEMLSVVINNCVKNGQINCSISYNSSSVVKWEETKLEINKLLRDTFWAFNDLNNLENLLRNTQCGQQLIQVIKDLRNYIKTLNEKSKELKDVLEQVENTYNFKIVTNINALNNNAQQSLSNSLQKALGQFLGCNNSQSLDTSLLLELSSRIFKYLDNFNSEISNINNNLSYIKNINDLQQAISLKGILNVQKAINIINITKGGDFTIFNALNLLFYDKLKFSLLLALPTVELTLAGDES